MKSVLLLASASVAAAHMEMTWPPPFRSKYSPFSNPATIDYTMTAPLLADGTNFPCKHYHIADLGTPSGRPTASFAAGQGANVTIGGGATHGGGSCQVSLSYDRGSSFTVLQSIEGGCPASTGSSSIDFAIPPDAPAGDALLAWSWFNNLGNREMYMNCAAVTITNGRRSRRSRRATHAPLSVRPALFTANIGNGCSTVDNADVKFPQPGPDLAIQSSRGTVPPSGTGCQSGSGDVPVYQPANPPPQQPPAQEEGPSDDNDDAVVIQVAPVAAPASAKAAVNAPVPPAAPAAPAPAQTGAAGAMAAGTACATEGRWSCLAGGTSFQRCASGMWSVVQAVAPGTVCRVGQSDSLAVAAAGAPSAPRARLRQLHRGI